MVPEQQGEKRRCDVGEGAIGRGKGSIEGGAFGEGGSGI